MEERLCGGGSGKWRGGGEERVRGVEERWRRVWEYGMVVYGGMD